MASNKELEAKIQALQHMLEGHGIRLPTETAETPEERADYIAYGSAEHAAFLGLVEVKNGEDTTPEIFTSRGRTWRPQHDARQAVGTETQFRIGIRSLPDHHFIRQAIHRQRTAGGRRAAGYGRHDQQGHGGRHPLSEKSHPVA